MKGILAFCDAIGKAFHQDPAGQDTLGDGAERASMHRGFGVCARHLLAGKGAAELGLRRLFLNRNGSRGGVNADFQ